MSERDQIINRAIHDQRISASQADEYRRLYDAQPAVIRRLLTAKGGEGGLMPGLASDSDALDGDYDPTWLTARERAALGARETTAPRPPAAPPAAPAPAQASATAPVAANGDDGYAEDWLSPKERSRIAAAKDGTLTHGPVEFEDDAAKSAAGAGAAAT